jgi:hypothetical protein
VADPPNVIKKVEKANRGESDVLHIIFYLMTRAYSCAVLAQSIHGSTLYAKCTNHCTYNQLPER